MEATIEELVDNLRKEKNLDGKEADEITEALRIASKEIEVGRMSGFIKSIRERIDAPISEIFTQNGLNINELKNVAEGAATVVIKEQAKEIDRAERARKELESEYVQDNGDRKEQENKKENVIEQEFRETRITDNINFLKQSMPGLDENTERRVAEGIFDAEIYAVVYLGHLNNGDSPDVAERKTCEDLGLDNSASEKAIRDRNIALAIRKKMQEGEKQGSQPENQQNSQQDSQKQAPHPNTNNITENIANLTPTDLFKCLSDLGQKFITFINGEPTQESMMRVEQMRNADAITSLREEIANLEEEIKNISTNGTNSFELMVKYKKLGHKRTKLRDTLGMDRCYRDQQGEKTAVENERAKKAHYLEVATERFLQKDNRETLVGIFESMIESAKAEGVVLEELIGFDDILSAVEKEILKYPEQVGNAEIIKLREQKNYDINMELKAIEITRSNAERKRKEQNDSGKKDEAEKFDRLTVRRSMRKKKLLKEVNRNVDENFDIKGNVIRVKRIFEKDKTSENDDVTTDLRQEEPSEPKKKKGFMLFIKSAASKFGITSKDLGEEVSVLSDLQKQEVHENTIPPKTIKDNKTNSPIEVSTINVGGEEQTVETQNPNVGDDER